MARIQKLTPDEVDLAYGDQSNAVAYPNILTVKQFARMFQVNNSTAYLWIAQGKLDGAVTKVGKHRRIWRNRVVTMLFNKGISNE
jgi:excisionase family DNA binding protein